MPPPPMMRSSCSSLLIIVLNFVLLAQELDPPWLCLACWGSEAPGFPALFLYAGRVTGALGIAGEVLAL